MKKIFLASILILSSFFYANACEICGCGNGNYYLGLVPGFHHHFFGVRYHYRNFKTVMADDPTQYSKDFYKSLELWGGINIGKKIQLIGVVPVNFIHQVSDDGITNRNGLGDIAFLLNYKLLDKTNALGNKLINHQLWVGAGLKLPTGKFNVDINDPMLITLANTQTGSASVDFMVNAVYNLTVNKFGLNTNVSYKINTANKDKFDFGNKFLTAVLANYTVRNHQTNLIPNIGLSYESIAANRLQSQKINLTGGNISLLTTGLEIGIKNITVGGNVQLPIAQNFANGQTETKIKGMMHIAFSF